MKTPRISLAPIIRSNAKDRLVAANGAGTSACTLKPPASTPQRISRLFVVLFTILGIASFGSTTTPVAAEDSPASLILNVYTCDAHHDPIDPNQTLINECKLGTDDISFTLEALPDGESGAGASTGTGGAPATLSFTQLTPGDYRLTQQTPTTIALSYISQCTSNLRTFTSPFSPFAIVEPDGRVNIQLLPGEELTCDWYNVQAPEEPAAAALTVTVYSCDGDVLDAGLCETVPGAELRLSNASAEIILTSDADGIATFDGSGDFAIEAITELSDRVPCGIHTSDNASVTNLTLDPANPTTLDAYYCYPGA